MALCKTKVGNGYKIVINELWLYASKHWVEKGLAKTLVLLPISTNTRQRATTLFFKH